MLAKLNGFNENIKFTYEMGKNGTLLFLDVLVMRDNNQVQTTVYHKPTNKGNYLDWHSFTPKNWKLSTIQSLILRAYKICSNANLRNIELDKIKTTFIDINGYPPKMVEQAISKIDNGILRDKEHSNQPLLKLHYKGAEGERLIRSLKRTLSNKVKSDVTPFHTIYNSTKLESRFNIKDRTNLNHEHNVVYNIDCPEPSCAATYIGETGRRITTRVTEHNKDSKSSIYMHTKESGHGEVTMENVNILARNCGNIAKRKIIEALHIKYKKPSLNSQDGSVPLMLF